MRRKDANEDIGTGREEARRPSKSARKRESLALQKLGEELAAMPQAERAELDLPEELREALDMHDRISDREGARRQRQFIGRLMREADADRIASSLALRRADRASRARRARMLEKWREKFLNAGEAELEELFSAFQEIPPRDNPDMRDMAALKELVFRAREEQKSLPGRPDASRQLFRAMAKMFEGRN